LTDLLLSVEPDNMQAQSLRTLIEQSVTRDGYIGKSYLCKRVRVVEADESGMGLLAGAAAVTGLVVAGVLKRARR
jgi:fission 1 protein